MRFNNKNIILPKADNAKRPFGGYIHMDATDYENDKRSYIDLNYVPTLTTNVEITLRLANNTFNYGDTYLFGMNGSPELYAPNGGFGARIRTNSSPTYYFEPTYGSHFEDMTYNITQNAGINTDFTVRYDQTTNSGYFTMYVDGTQYKQWEKADSLQNLSLFIFAVNNNNASYIYACPEEQVKEIKIFEGSTLVRDYFPQDNNGVIGLFDNVEKVLYTPTGECKMVIENA